MSLKVLNIVSRKIMRNERLNIFLAKHCLWLHLHLMYCSWKDRWPRFGKPRDLNEWLLRLSWRNSHNKQMRELIPQCADKVAVRDYVAQKGYAHTLIECFGAYDHVKDIPFDSLPVSFVLKMNNASGRNQIVTSKRSCQGKCFSQFEDWLKDREFGLTTGEWQYSLIEPKIIVEKYISNLGEKSLIDYKFNCIHGKPYSCFVGYDRDPKDPHGSVCFDDYDLDWNLTDNIYDKWHKNRRELPKPQCWEQMKEMAATLAGDFEYVRVDLYEVDGKILFGELTFTPQGCVQEFYKEEYLQKIIGR